MADIVQHRRDFQVGAHSHGQTVQPRELIEQRHGEFLHLHSMGLVKEETTPHGPRGVDKRGIVHIPKTPAHQIHKHAVAQTAIDGGDRVKGKMVGQRLQDHGAGDDDLGASGIEALVPFIGIHARQILYSMRDLLGRGVRGALGRGTGDDGPDRSRAAQRHARKTADPWRQRVFHGFARELAQQAKLLGRHLAVALENLGQSDRADGHAPQFRRLVADGASHFGRTAPDVDAQRPRLGRPTGQHAQTHKPGLFLA